MIGEEPSMLFPRLTSVSLATLALIVVGCDERLPTTKPTEADKDAPYIAVNVGDRLVYERTIRDRSGESNEVVTQVITAVETKRGLVVTADYHYGDEKKPRRTLQFHSTDEGVFWIGHDGQTFEAPECILKLPTNEGDNWQCPFGGRPEVVIRYTTGKEEEVEVPAGKFRARRVESAMTSGGVKFESTDWYASGVGLVKTTLRTDDGENEVKVLKSFTRGKK
jgi:hypothetical protein